MSLEISKGGLRQDSESLHFGGVKGNAGFNRNAGLNLIANVMFSRVNDATFVDSFGCSFGFEVGSL
jgi:hypothetical protein